MNAQTVTYAYDNAGNRTARVVTLLKSSTATQTAKATATFNDMVAEKKIVIYPNPTRGIVKVDITGYTNDTKASFRLMSMSGQTISARIPEYQTLLFQIAIKHPEPI